jgi:hypothetical protein
MPLVYFIIGLFSGVLTLVGLTLWYAREHGMIHLNRRGEPVLTMTNPHMRLTFSTEVLWDSTHTIQQAVNLITSHAREAAQSADINLSPGLYSMTGELVARFEPADH